MDYRGVVVSDDMQMKAISDHYSLEQAITLAINAGVDLLLFANTMDYDPQIAARAHSAIKRMVAEGSVTRVRIFECVSAHYGA